MRPLPRRTTSTIDRSSDLSSGRTSGPRFPRFSRLARGLVAGTAATAVAIGLGTFGPASPAQADNRVTPGDFTGYGFDQCVAPTQYKMNRWLTHSPFHSVGIYISGDSRGCRSQPNLTPTWIKTQLANGWRLLPITLGPQASCSPHFPRYGSDETIKPWPGSDGLYRAARKQGSAEATKAVTAAKRLGISAKSTLWYDLEAFDSSNTRCRESAIAFLSSWTVQIRKLGYVSGVYSSASSGIKMLDDARVAKKAYTTLPDQIWLARWDGVANTSSSYLRSDGWRPGGRVKQYQGGHNETWGGVTINIDRNFLDVGRGSVYPAPKFACGGRVDMDLSYYATLSPSTTNSSTVKTLQCMLKQQGYLKGYNGNYGKVTQAAVRRWQADHGQPISSTWSRRNWMVMHLDKISEKVVKYGSTGSQVRRIQRALNAARYDKLSTSGVFTGSTTTSLKAYQRKLGLAQTGVANPETWKALRAGRW